MSARNYDNGKDYFVDEELEALYDELETSDLEGLMRNRLAQADPDCALESVVSTLLHVAPYFPLLTPEQERQLVKQAHYEERYNANAPKEEHTHEARDFLIMSNLRFIYKFSKKYAGKAPVADAFMAGIIGYMTAISKFEVSKKTRLNTYAAAWIRQTVQRAMLTEIDSRTKVPVYFQDKINSLAKIKAKLEESLQRAVTMEDIAQAAGMDVKEVRKYLQAPRLDTVSLDAHVSGDPDNNTLGDFIRDDDDDILPGELLEKDELREYIERAVQGLPFRTIQILSYTFGLNGCERLRTNEAVARKINELYPDSDKSMVISKERVRQIVSAALKKLHEGVGEELTEYVINNNIIKHKSEENREDVITEKGAIEHMRAFVDALPSAQERRIVSDYYGLSISLRRVKSSLIAEAVGLAEQEVLQIVDRIEREMVAADPYLKAYFDGE